MKCFSSKCFYGNLKSGFDNFPRKFVVQNLKFFAQGPKMIKRDFYHKKFSLKMSLGTLNKQFWRPRRETFNRKPEIFHSTSIKDVTNLFKNAASQRFCGHIASIFDDPVEKIKTKSWNFSTQKRHKKPLQMKAVIQRVPIDT